MKDDKAIQNLCLHTHTIYCDGKQDMETLIISAINQNVKQIGISSHAPIKIPNNWSMDIKMMDKYRSEITKLKAIYKNQIDIFASLEIDYIPGMSYPFDYFKKQLKLDYTIGSIHLVKPQKKNQLWFIDGDKQTSIDNMLNLFDGEARQAVQCFYKQSREMIRSQKPDIIGHLDKVIMNTAHLIDVNDNWYQKEIENTLWEIKKHNVIVEANTRGLYKGKWKDTFPSAKILKLCYEMDIPVLISSDAHHSKELLLHYPQTLAKLKQIGFKYIQGRNNSEWVNLPINLSSI